MNLKTITKYLCSQLTGNFLGFLIGASATGLVSQFFETRSFKNLWGLTAKKTLVNKETFHNLEWIISIVIGFIFFEIFTKLIMKKVAQKSPSYKRAIFRFIIRENLREKYTALRVSIKVKRIVFFTAIHQGVKQAVNRF